MLHAASLPSPHLLCSIPPACRTDSLGDHPDHHVPHCTGVPHWSQSLLSENANLILSPVSLESSVSPPCVLQGVQSSSPPPSLDLVSGRPLHLPQRGSWARSMAPPLPFSVAKLGICKMPPINPLSFETFHVYLKSGYPHSLSPHSS